MMRVSSLNTSSPQCHAHRFERLAYLSCFKPFVFKLFVFKAQRADAFLIFLYDTIRVLFGCDTLLQHSVMSPFSDTSSRTRQGFRGEPCSSSSCRSLGHGLRKALSFLTHHDSCACFAHPCFHSLSTLLPPPPSFCTPPITFSRCRNRLPVGTPRGVFCGGTFALHRWKCGATDENGGKEWWLMSRASRCVGRGGGLTALQVVVSSVLHVR